MRHEGKFKSKSRFGSKMNLDKQVSCFNVLYDGVDIRALSDAMKDGDCVVFVIFL